MTDIEQNVKDQLARISDETKERGEKALAEAKKGIQMAEAEKARVDELLVKQGELIQRLKEVEQKSVRADEEGEESRKSVGQQFVESEGFQSLANEKGRIKYNMNFKAVTDITSATTGTGAAGDLVVRDRVQGIMAPGLRRLTIRDLFAKGRTSSNLIEFVQESGFQNMAAIQAEGATKAQSDIAFTDASAPVVTIAHWMRATKQILADAPRLQSYIDGRMRYGLKLKEEAQLLLGDNTSGNINGVYTQATSYSAPAGGYGGDLSDIDATPIDILRLALLQAELAEYPADGIVLNPIQWAAIETLKDTTGRYIIGDPKSNLTPRLWNRDVVPTQAITTDKFLVGAFGMGGEVFDREDANVLVSTEDGDNFVKNKVTILCEERLALAIYRAEAFIKGALGMVA